MLSRDRGIVFRVKLKFLKMSYFSHAHNIFCCYSCCDMNLKSFVIIADDKNERDKIVKLVCALKSFQFS